MPVDVVEALGEVEPRGHCKAVAAPQPVELRELLRSRRTQTRKSKRVLKEWEVGLEPRDQALALLVHF